MIVDQETDTDGQPSRCVMAYVKIGYQPNLSLYCFREILLFPARIPFCHLFMLVEARVKALLLWVRTGTLRKQIFGGNLVYCQAVR